MRKIKKLKVKGPNRNILYIQIKHQRLNWKQIKFQRKEKWLKKVIKTKMLESKITITIRTIVYSPRYEREMKEEKKERVTSDTPTTFREHVLSIIEEQIARNKMRWKKLIFYRWKPSSALPKNMAAPTR